LLTSDANATHTTSFDSCKYAHAYMLALRLPYYCSSSGWCQVWC
jgi:hypothetical protein